VKELGRLVAFVAAFALVVSTCPAAAEYAIGGDMVVTKGMKPWEGCGECHDLNGIAPNGHFPNLAAQKASYIRKEMADFADDTRTNDHGQMGTSAQEATGATLDQIVAYFADLSPPPPVPARDANPAAIARAALLVEHGSRPDKIPACRDCHSAHPKHAFDAPWLEAQQPAYLVKELEDFRADRRTNDPNHAMRRVARVLSDDDIDALAAYLASLPRPSATSGLAAGAENGR
jgi:cytochrome c553